MNDDAIAVVERQQGVSDALELFGNPHVILCALMEGTTIVRIQRMAVRARVHKHRPGEMNAGEARYARHLDLRRLAGDIADWRFEAIKLRLAPSTFYTIDFFVVAPDGYVELHELKGRQSGGADGFVATDAGWMKTKLAAESFPWFKFLVVWERPRREGGGYRIEEVGA